MLTPRMPLYIPCVYIVFMYTGTLAANRFGLRHGLAEAALAGLLGELIYSTYDITGECTCPIKGSHHRNAHLETYNERESREFAVSGCSVSPRCHLDHVTFVMTVTEWVAGRCGPPPH